MKLGKIKTTVLHTHKSYERTTCVKTNFKNLEATFK
jgi:anti-sigma factor ChrR (cupin superfamily)